MKKLFTAIGAAAVLVAVAPAARAQNTAPSTVYEGPRYPGGPDSLRSLVACSTRTTTPSPTGQMMVQFELQPDGKPTAFSIARPSETLASAPVNAKAGALTYLITHMPAWQLGTPEPTPLPEKYRKLNLVIDFTTPAAAQPYHYPDQNPVFPDLATMSPSRSNKKTQRTTEGNAKNLIANIQKQTRYPPISLRDNQQGTVHVYFEVAENGAVENAKVLSVDGSVGRELEAEVLRVVALIPPAVAPATVAGRPVRLYYALPITFKIM